VSKKTSDKTIARLSLYRLMLDKLRTDGAPKVFSHHLAGAAGCSAAQVRRDVMEIHYTGSPATGYDVSELTEAIDNFLDHPDGTNVALVGVGNLGRAVLDFFRARRPKLSIIAAFDHNQRKTGRVIHGCWCFHTDQLIETVRDKNIQVAIVTVPAAVAQQVADRLVEAGVKGILNFAPLRLKAPRGVWVENVDITISLEKVAYFSRLSDK
jgi:redox-sensing transcriptional repressor